MAPEVGAEALTGLFLYVQDRLVIGGEGTTCHVMDLPGSVHRGGREGCAYLGLIGDGPRLCWCWVDFALPQYGAGSRGE